MRLQTPPKPKKGDTVRIISPSAGLLPFVPERLARATKVLESIGLHVQIAEHAAKNTGYVSASIEERVIDIHEAFRDTTCSIVFASIGGNHSNQLVKRLDYDLIRNNPKVFIGYSDNTVLHYAMATQAGLQTYYGPCLINQFGEYPEVLPYTIEHFISEIMDQKSESVIKPSERYTDEILDWFAKDDMKRPRLFEKNSGFEWWREGSATGWAYPFTIPSINHILGTPYAPNPSGSILMVDIPEGHTMHEGLSIADIDSYLTDLKLSGMLDSCNGIIVGRPYKYSAEMLSQLKEVLLRITDGNTYPILANINLGHVDPVITVPIGSQVTIDSTHPDYFIIKNK